jgi:hypothetical protein
LLGQLNTSIYPKISLTVKSFRDLLGMIRDVVDEINERLKVAKIPVRVRLNGNRLVLRATLPKKPGEGSGTKQYDLSLGIPANKDGFRRIEAEAAHPIG